MASLNNACSGQGLRHPEASKAPPVMSSELITVRKSRQKAADAQRALRGPAMPYNANYRAGSNGLRQPFNNPAKAS